MRHVQYRLGTRSNSRVNLRITLSNLPRLHRDKLSQGVRRLFLNRV